MGRPCVSIRVRLLGDLDDSLRVHPPQVDRPHAEFHRRQAVVSGPPSWPVAVGVTARSLVTGGQSPFPWGPGKRLLTFPKRAQVWASGSSWSDAHLTTVRTKAAADGALEASTSQK